jgi:WD40-like Beta Propeller Repeat
MHLFTSQLNTNGKLSKAEKMDFCNDEINYMHPSLNAAGTQVVFSSDSQGEGGMDIFVSHKKKDKWGTPKNLGAVVNTQRHEAFPYFGQDGKLYFASKGHGGLGGFDVFVTHFDSILQVWTQPINLGKPINSPSDDLGFAFAPGDTAGTFTSTRVTGNDDIYFFWLSGLEPNWSNYFAKQVLIQTPIDSSESATEPKNEQKAVQISPIIGKSGDQTAAERELETQITFLSTALAAQNMELATTLLPDLIAKLDQCPNSKIQVNCNTEEQRAAINTLICSLEETCRNQWVTILAPTESGKMSAILIK